MAEPHAIILAGGSGTRFWPASRKRMPKQLLALAPGSTDPLLARTLKRIEPLCAPDRILIATGEHLLDATRKVASWLPDSAFLAEPVARNTAACIGWAASVVARTAPDAPVMVLPSDQYVRDETTFVKALELALASAASGVITTIGISPERAETGYGYIELGEPVSEGVRRVARFVEKPDRATAEQYLASGRYVWNSGMFFFTARVMLDAISTHMPDLSRGLDRIGAAAADRDREGKVTREVFEGLASVSIDYGVMEHMSQLNVVPASFGWSDLGSWESAWEMSERDAQGNTADCEVVCVDARGNLVRAAGLEKKKLVALVGVDDLCVVETDDVLLVMPRERAQDIKKAVEELERRGRRDVL